jgi:hypothetical protein
MLRVSTLQNGYILFTHVTHELLDRLVILFEILPGGGAIEDIRLKNGSSEKLKLSTSENRLLTYEANGMIRIEAKNLMQHPEMFNTENEYELTEPEGIFLRRAAEYASRSGMVQTETLETFEKVMAATEVLEPTDMQPAAN